MVSLVTCREEESLEKKSWTNNWPNVGFPVPIYSRYWAITMGSYNAPMTIINGFFEQGSIGRYALELLQ